MSSTMPAAWLADFITAEVQSLVDWRRATISKSRVKLEFRDDTRFTNDYSNLRSYHSVAPAQCGILQILEILSRGEIVTAYLSDGHVQIRARLFADAVARLEDEMGQKIEPGFGGDVIKLETFTVVTTHMGVDEGFFQLEIERLDYKHHLRRKLGNPQPIQNVTSLIVLAREVERVWHQENPASVSSDDDEGSDHESPTMVHASQPLHKNRQAAVASQSNSHGLIEDMALSNVPANEGSNGRKRRATATLDEDGFEIMDHVNLGPPRTASMQAPPSRPLKRTHNIETAAVKDKSRQMLLGLLKQNQSPHPMTAPEMLPNIHTPVVSIQTQTERDSISTQLNSQADVSPIGRQVVEPEKDHRTSRSDVAREAQIQPEKLDLRVGQPPTPKTASKTATNQVDEQATRSPVDLQPQQSPKAVSINESESHINTLSSSYVLDLPLSRASLVVPPNQSKLLQHPSSWYPSLPGEDFPIPNVPTEIMKSWIVSLDQAQERAQKTPTKAVSTRQRSTSSETPMSSPSPSASSLSWSASPSQRRAELPPDSSAESVQHRRNEDDLEMSVPQALSRRAASVHSGAAVPSYTPAIPSPPPVNERAPPAIQKQQQPNTSLSPSIQSQPSPQLSGSGQQNQSRMEMVPEQAPRTSRSPQAMPMPENDPSIVDSSTQFAQQPPPISSAHKAKLKTGKPSILQSVESFESSQKEPALISLPKPNVSGKTIQHTPTQSRQHLNSSPTHDVDPEPTNIRQNLPQSSPTRQSPVLQSSARSPSVHGAVQDPSARHLAARSAFFKRSLQRRDWLKNKYTMNKGGNIELATIVQDYHRNFADDEDATLDDFISISENLFPDERDAGKLRFQRRPAAMPLFQPSPLPRMQPLKWPPPSPVPRLHPLEWPPPPLPRLQPLEWPPPPPTQPQLADKEFIPRSSLQESSNSNLEDPTPPSNQPMVIHSSSSLDVPPSTKPLTNTRRAANAPVTTIPAAGTAIVLPSSSSSLSLFSSLDKLKHSGLDAELPEPGRGSDQSPLPANQEHRQQLQQRHELPQGQKQQHRQQSKGKERENGSEHVPETGKEAETATMLPIPTFERFRNEWNSVAPGGAFAEPRPVEPDKRSETPRRIDVLNWEI